MDKLDDLLKKWNITDELGFRYKLARAIEAYFRERQLTVSELQECGQTVCKACSKLLSRKQRLRNKES